MTISGTTSDSSNLLRNDEKAWKAIFKTFLDAAKIRKAEYSILADEDEITFVSSDGAAREAVILALLKPRTLRKAMGYATLELTDDRETGKIIKPIEVGLAGPTYIQTAENLTRMTFKRKDLLNFFRAVFREGFLLIANENDATPIILPADEGGLLFLTGLSVDTENVFEINGKCYYVKPHNFLDEWSSAESSSAESSESFDGNDQPSPPTYTPLQQVRQDRSSGIEAFEEDYFRQSSNCTMS